MKFLRNWFGIRKPQPYRTRPALESLEDRVVQYGGHGLQFNFTSGTGAATPTAQVLAGVQQAANLWSSILSDDVVVNIRVDMGSIPLGGSAQALPLYQSKSLSVVRDALAADQTSLSDISAVAHLPAGDSASIYITNYTTGQPVLDNGDSDNNQYFSATRANLKAMGLLAGNDPTLDGVIKVTSNLGIFDFDRSNGIAAGKYDFVGDAVHEIGHLLGFISGAATVDFRTKPNGPGWVSGLTYEGSIIARPLDLFRFSADSIAQGADFDLRADKAAKFFSIDGGANNLGNFATGIYNGDGGEGNHWKDHMGLGAMDPGSAGGEYIDIKALDAQALDVIGWDLVMDYGDAPDTGVGIGPCNYQATRADDGPRHITFSPSALLSDPAGAPKVFLGTGVTAELNGQPTATANGDLDNGIAAIPNLVAGTTVQVTVASSATAAKHAVLNYFVDFNQNGNFNDAGEAFAVTLTSASQVVPIVVPAGAAIGSSFARFRISTAGGLGSTGPANDGEVEDYLVAIVAPHSPNVGNAVVLEDALSDAIPIGASPNEGITHFKISGNAGGQLFKADGVTPIANGDFLTVAEGQAGVRFLPTANSNLAGHFDVESSQDGITVAAQSGKATSTIAIIPLGDTPQVANVATLEGKLSAAIVIGRNPADGAEVTHFRITGITGGTLFKSDGTTPINNGDFVTFAEAQAGVKFLPAVNSVLTGHFAVEASQDGSTVSVQSGKAVSTISVTPISLVQIAGVVGGSQLAVTANINGGAFTGGGTLTAPNGQYYNVVVKSGTRQGSVVKLQGTISPPGSTALIAFTLDVDSSTGFIQFSYKGAKGLLITQNTFGVVVLQ